MMSLQRKSEVALNFSSNSSTSRSGRNSKRNSYSQPFINDATSFYDDATDLFIGYKMTVHVKQKKINRFHLDNQLHIESFIRFCSFAVASKTQPNLQSLSPFASKDSVI